MCRLNHTLYVTWNGFQLTQLTLYKCDSAIIPNINNVLVRVNPMLNIELNGNDPRYMLFDLVVYAALLIRSPDV